MFMDRRAVQHDHQLRKADFELRDRQAMPRSISGLPHAGWKAGIKNIGTAASGLALVRISGLQPRLAARQSHAHANVCHRHVDAPRSGAVAASHRGLRDLIALRAHAPTVGNVAPRARRGICHHACRHSRSPMAARPPVATRGRAAAALSPTTPKPATPAPTTPPSGTS